MHFHLLSKWVTQERATISTSLNLWQGRYSRKYLLTRMESARILTILFSHHLKLSLLIYWIAQSSRNSEDKGIKMGLELAKVNLTSQHSWINLISHQCLLKKSSRIALQTKKILITSVKKMLSRKLKKKKLKPCHHQRHPRRRKSPGWSSFCLQETKSLSKHELSSCFHLSNKIIVETVQNLHIVKKCSQLTQWNQRNHLCLTKRSWEEWLRVIYYRKRKPTNLSIQKNPRLHSRHFKGTLNSTPNQTRLQSPQW